jgi:ERCC4-type nuclease
MRGLNSYEKIRDASDQQLLATDGIGQARIEQIRRYLAEYFADD